MGDMTMHSCMAAALPLLVQRVPTVHLKGVRQLPTDPGSKLNRCSSSSSLPETAWGCPVAPAASQYVPQVHWSSCSQRCHCASCADSSLHVQVTQVSVKPVLTYESFQLYNEFVENIIAVGSYHLEGKTLRILFGECLASGFDWPGDCTAPGG